MKNKSPFLACLLILAIIIFAASCGGGGGGGGSVVAFGNNSGPHNGGDAGGWGNGGYNGNGFGGNGGGIGSGNEGEIVITGSTPLNVTKYVYNGTEYSDVKALTTALKASGNLPDSFNVDFYVGSETTPRTARVTANGKANNGQDIFIEHQYKAFFPDENGGSQDVFFYKRDGITLPGDPAGTVENGFTFETNWNIDGSLYPCGSTIGVAASGDVDFLNASPVIAPYGFKEESGEYILGFSSSATGNIAINTNKVIKQVDLTSGSSMNLDFTGVTFKNNVINSSSFTGTAANLAGITLPSGLTSIGNGTFLSGYSNLETVVIPGSVTSIGDLAFKTCSALENISFLGSGLQTIGDSAFYSCSSLQTFEMPDSVTTLGANAFYSCSNLATLTLSNHLTEIPNNAFYNCSSLDSTLDIPASVTAIGNSAFQDCSSIDALTLHTGLTAIGDNAFQGCLDLDAVSIPNGVTTIGTAAFLSCSNLAEISIPPSVSSIGNSAFNGVKTDCVLTINSTGGQISLGTLALPNSDFKVKLTGTGIPINPGTSKLIFRSNPNLTSLEIGSSITAIPEQAFMYCANLETVTFSSPSTVSTIGRNAFNGCSIRSIELPNSVTTIDVDAFYDCANLASITIPASVTTMGSAGPSTPFSGTCGDSVSGGCTLIFKGANSFSGYAILPGSAYKVVLEGGVPTKNGTSIFSNDTNLTSVSYEGGSNLIANAFMGCSSLETVTFKSYPSVIQTTPLPGNVRNIIFEPDLNPMTNLANVGNLFPSTMNYSLLTVTFKNDSSSPHITIKPNAFNFGGANNIRYEFAAHPNNNITYDDGNCFLSTARTTFSATNFTWDSTNKTWH